MSLFLRSDLSTRVYFGHGELWPKARHQMVVEGETSVAHLEVRRIILVTSIAASYGASISATMDQVGRASNSCHQRSIGCPPLIGAACSSNGRCTSVDKQLLFWLSRKCLQLPPTTQKHVPTHDKYKGISRVIIEEQSVLAEKLRTGFSIGSSTENFSDTDTIAHEGEFTHTSDTSRGARPLSPFSPHCN